jgi:hypothetical protein
MYGSFRSARALRHGLFLAALLALGGLTPAHAHAQKNINFSGTGSLTSSILFTNQISPDVYSFFAEAGQQIRLQTSNNGFDTTLRVIGPDSALSLFDDDSAGGLASRIVFTVPDTGSYIVVVSSFSGNPITGSGTYTLTFARGVGALAAGREPTGGNTGVSQQGGNNPVEPKR